MSLQGFDLNLLRVLEALIDERSVTRAAKRLGRSQPAVSNSLSRLRKLLGDDLLVLTGKGMILTPRAEALQSSVRDVLVLAEKSLFHRDAFDPTVARGIYRISMPDRLTLAILPPLLKRIRDAAPAIDVHLVTAARAEAIRLLDDEETDLGLGWFDDIPRRCRSDLLRDEQIYCVFRSGHPITRSKFTIDTVLAYPHLVVTGRGRTSAIFDDLLQRHGKKRRAQTIVSSFSSVPQLLASSDMIGVFTQLAADAFASSYKLSKRPVPLDVGTISTYMVWHARNDRDARHDWLRKQVRAVYQTL
ncbi:MAG: LysR family transcriptional regulator [Pseudolabrys sp.]|jgi:DNA-binding transcriptional LysR family regulator